MSNTYQKYMDDSIISQLIGLSWHQACSHLGLWTSTYNKDCLSHLGLQHGVLYCTSMVKIKFDKLLSQFFLSFSLFSISASDSVSTFSGELQITRYSCSCFTVSSFKEQFQSDTTLVFLRFQDWLASNIITLSSAKVNCLWGGQELQNNRRL